MKFLPCLEVLAYLQLITILRNRAAWLRASAQFSSPVASRFAAAENFIYNAA